MLITFTSRGDNFYNQFHESITTNKGVNDVIAQAVMLRLQGIDCDVIFTAFQYCHIICRERDDNFDNISLRSEYLIIR